MFAFKIIIYSFQIIKFSTFEMKGEQLFKKTKTDKKVVLLSPRLSYCLLNMQRRLLNLFRSRFLVTYPIHNQLILELESVTVCHSSFH